MMIRTRSLAAICLIVVLAAFAIPSNAQEAVSADLWRLVPPNSLLIAGFDTRPDNPSMQAIANVQSPETQDLLVKQQAALRKAMEDFALLFGISLDFAKDFQPWVDQQWALMLLPDDKDSVLPVLAIGSKDESAAKAALDKLTAPWHRIGDLASKEESGYRITSFKMEREGVEVYVAASGPVLAISPSKDALIQVLTNGGVAEAGNKTLNALSGSMFYAYMDPALLKVCKAGLDMVPVAGFGLGASVVETGVKIRLLGLPTEQGAAFLNGCFGNLVPGTPGGQTQQTTALMANPAMPSTCLVEATLPNMSSFAAIAGMFGATNNPIFAAVQEIGDTQISGALTAALPMPAGFVSAMAESDQAATDKLAKIAGSLKQTKLAVKNNVTISDIKATAIEIRRGPTMYLTQIGNHIVLASDTQSLGTASATIKGDQPSLAQSDTYKETMAGLADSNLITLYANLAPVQGLGFLAEGLGMGQWPCYGSVIKCLQNMQAMGLGAGFDGEMLNATLFLRAKPEIGPTIGPAIVGGTAIAAAVVLPVFARAREEARRAECMHNLRELAIAAECYAVDHGGRLPSMTNWQSELEDYADTPISELTCPSGEAIYAFNKNLGGAKLNKLSNQSDVVLFFEAKPGLPNRTGSRANAILPHGRRGHFAYADGHIECLWEPPSQPHWVPSYPTKSR